MKYLIILIFSFLGYHSWSQSISLDSLEVYIDSMATKMHTDKEKDNRVFAATEIEKKLTEALVQKGSFEYPFSNLKGISLVKPNDNKLRVFTWELYVDKDEYIQFGIIQTADEKIFVLKDKSKEIKQAEFSKLKFDNWYGALYYHIQAFEVNNATQYLLLGRDSYKFSERRKVVDVLYFDQTGKPKFGNYVIEVKDGRGKIQNVCRYFLQYSASANVLLRYDPELKMVVYDHLVSGPSPIEGGPESAYPDGSFCGLKYAKGKWNYVDMVFEYDPKNVLENAVNPSQIMSRTKKKENNKDIFGRDLDANGKVTKTKKKEPIIQP